MSDCTRMPNDAIVPIPSPSVRIDLHSGDRSALRPLFELAEDSAPELDRYLHLGRVLVARVDTEVVGHLQLVTDDAPDAAEIKNMAVVAMARRRGIGTRLVRRALELLRDENVRCVKVATAAADTDNLRFYQRQGFRLASIERDAFTPEGGYPPGTNGDGIDLRDRVWLDRPVIRRRRPRGSGNRRPLDLAASDRELVSAAAARLGVPRRSVPAASGSFVLHAPLELLARAALLPAVALGARARARRRIATLVDGYEAAAAPLGDEPLGDEPVGDQPVGGPAGDGTAACTALVDALTRRDAVAADAAAAALDHDAGGALASALAPIVLPVLAAAGHANIYCALLARPTVAQPPTAMLRAVVRSLTTDNAPSMPIPEIRVADDPGATHDLVTRLFGIRPVGPPPSPFIAPLVEHAVRHGILEALAPHGTFAAPPRAPRALLRYAAQAMLQGDDDHAPYGWTHCLTLAQGALRAGELAGTEPLGTYVAATYLAAHWAAFGVGGLDVHAVPDPPRQSLERALATSPRDAAAAAWHEPDRARTAQILATRAAVNHDAHRVKYTLACLDAARDDPEAQPLYLAAAAFLAAWWELHGDPDDPWA